METSTPVVKQQKQFPANTSEIHYLLFAPLIQRSICFVATIGIPDLLADHPQSAEELANETKMHAPFLYRVLRALAGAGIFRLNSENKFQNTPLSDVLRGDAPNSIRDFAIMLGRERMWNTWGALPKSVASGTTAQRLIYGQETFDYFQQNPDEAEIFNRAMTANTNRSIPAILDAYDFSNINTLIDVGGGEGILLAKILKAYPKMRGVLFELPSVVETSDKTFLKEGVKERVELVPGDFLKQAPPEGDAYILKFVIHDWNDEYSKLILKNVAAVMHRESKLLLLESIMPEGNEPSFAKLRDLQMMLGPGGMERTENEYQVLLNEAGLRITKIHPTRSFLDIIEVELR